MSNISKTMIKNNHNSLDEILRIDLPNLLAKQRVLEKSTAACNRVDGAIIGTGQSDFTQDNVYYPFELDGTPFQLIDVPGIEGNEIRFEEMVRVAVAKAHMVLYVNGTNKKPEAQTARKIKQYLNRDAVIYVVCNLRGKADKYEFDEDRIALEQTHQDALDIKNQTLLTLETMFNSDSVIGGQTVQGLLAFCGLAYDENAVSTIIADRPELNKAQLNYQSVFKTPEKMYSFSQIDILESLIRNKVNNFNEDIVESNKRKMRSVFYEALGEIKQIQENHIILVDKISSEITASKKKIIWDVNQFEKNFTRQRNGEIHKFFNELHDLICDAIENDFGDGKEIEDKIAPKRQELQTTLVKNIEKYLKKCTNLLTENIERELKRINQNIQNLKFEHELTVAVKTSSSLEEALNASTFTANDFGNSLLRIVPMAFSGTFVGPIGVAVGAIAGIILSIINLFLSRSTKVRQQQADIRLKLDDQQKEMIDQMNEQKQTILKTVQHQIRESVFCYFESEISNLTNAGHILEHQIDIISAATQSLEVNR
tara:strand:+ start:16928 stop:18547 length:1620 start_codon:yes stop_codon:yes gene_type:complete